MIYGNVPMMIFILAAGYLFTVYLLLALAKRTGKKTASKSVSAIVKAKHKQEISVTPNVSEVVNSQ
jgi:DhnA family fructose-bisphosphate aldolase class Ia